MKVEHTLNILIDQAKVMRNYQRQYNQKDNTEDDRKRILKEARKAEQEFDALIRAYLQQTMPF